MIKVKYTGDRDVSGKPTRAIGPEDRQIISLNLNSKEVSALAWPIKALT